MQGNPDMDRDDVTAAVIAGKRKAKVSWQDLAAAVGLSKEWTTAALLGQMQMTAAEAAAAGELLGLDAEAVALLQEVPTKGSLGRDVPTDPTLYRFHELLLVYGTTIKALMAEEFGDGIMSAIDFSMDVSRVADPKGDRVRVTLNGKFLPFRRY